MIRSKLPEGLEERIREYLLAYYRSNMKSSVVIGKMFDVAPRTIEKIIDQLHLDVARDDLKTNNPLFKPKLGLYPKISTRRGIHLP